MPAHDPDGLDRVFREEHGRVVAALTRRFGDIDVAEEAAQEAYLIAVQRWPESGLPPNPGAWLTTTAQNRAIDRIRRESTRDTRQAQAAMITDSSDPDETISSVVDDRLRLMFTCCHPALATSAQIALTLRLLGGLTVAEIASAFLVDEAAMAKRLTRSKQKIKAAKIPYRVPPDAELPGRIRGVLATLFLVFNEGYLPSTPTVTTTTAATTTTTTTGTTTTTLAGGGLQAENRSTPTEIGAAPVTPAGGEIRTDLCAEAIRLTRILATLMPDEPEVLGLLALMLLSDARRPSRISGRTLVALPDQDRSRWDQALIAEGHGIVRTCLRRGRPGRYQILAAINAVHTDAGSIQDTDWRQIVALYDQLIAVDPPRSSPSTGPSRWARWTDPQPHWQSLTPSRSRGTTPIRPPGRTCSDEQETLPPRSGPISGLSSWRTTLPNGRSCRAGSRTPRPGRPVASRTATARVARHDFCPICLDLLILPAYDLHHRGTYLGDGEEQTSIPRKRGTLAHIPCPARELAHAYRPDQFSRRLPGSPGFAEVSTSRKRQLMHRPAARAR